MKNYIAENILYFVKLSKLSQDDFGAMFDLKRGSINSYASGKSLPKVETIQKICIYFKVTIDDFINLDLTAKSYEVKNVSKEVAEPNFSDKDMLIEAQRETIEVQKQLIKNLEVQLGHAS